MERRAPPVGWVSPQETNYLLQHLINGQGDQRETAKPVTEVLNASGAQPVVVDFWAEWCRPCHMLAPTVAEIAHDYAGKVKVTKLNVDEAMNSAGRYNIRGIPTILVFKGGQVVEQIVGAVPKDQITKALDRHVG
jgi:thioredoxin 1